MKKHLLLFFTISIATTSFGQSGTVGSPYTSIGQARNVTTAGFYFFNLNGNPFNTYVDDNGYVQIIRDFGTATGDLPTTSSFPSTNTRGILPTAALSNMNNIKEVRISTTTGNTDFYSTDATMISRVKNGTTLHLGAADYELNDSWNGTGTPLLTAEAYCSTSSGSTLDQNIINPCGNGNTFHWIPNLSMHREQNAGVESPATVAFILWVRAHDANILPLNLLKFEGKKINDRSVILSWQTSSEVNSNYYEVERSSNNTDWVFVNKVNARQNSSSISNYSITDNTIFTTNTYYRLKLVDHDGKISYSKIIMIKNEKNGTVTLYPTMTSSAVTLNGVTHAQFRIYSCVGQDVSKIVGRQNMGIDSWKLDFFRLPKGIYRVIGEGFALPVIVQ